MAAVSAAWCVWAGTQSARTEAGDLRAVPERARIIAGEPLVLRVSITNSSGETLLIAMGPSWMGRETEGADGRTVRWPNREAAEPELIFSIGIELGESRDVTVAATETASLREPGPYTMNLTINAVHLSTTVHFLVLPHDASQLGQRAAEFADQAVRLNDLEAEKALNAMPSSLAEPYMCDVLKGNMVMLPLGVPRLEELRTPESLGCLIDLVPMYRDPYRLLLVNALRRIERTADWRLRVKIDRALAEAK